MAQVGMHEVSTEEMNRHYFPNKEIFSEASPRSPLSTHSPDVDSIDLDIEDVVDTSIEQLYHNVCDMQSSDQSPSRISYLSYGEESRIDSELRYLAIGDIGEEEIQEEGLAENGNANAGSQDAEKPEDEKLVEVEASLPSTDQLASFAQAKKASRSKLGSEASKKSGVRNKLPRGLPRAGKHCVKGTKKVNAVSSLKDEKNSPSAGLKSQKGKMDPSEAAYLGPYILKQSRDLICSGENPQRALELALRAKNCFELSANGKTNLEYVMCLHVVAALYCRISRYMDAIPLLERSIEIPDIELGQNHALAKFAGHMQLGDTYAMMGQMENSLLCYKAGLEIQKQVLGENDPRFAETCRYTAEAHVQAMQFDEAEKLCRMALQIHSGKVSLASPEEVAGRRLLGLICDSKGDLEAALEQYVLASMAMAANGQEEDVASIDCNIGDIYLSFGRFDEAIFAYQKALKVFRSAKGENHISVASVLVRLADLHNKIGKFTECKTYCEDALRIYMKSTANNSREEIVSGLVDISAIYESMNDTDQALKLLQRAVKVYGDAAGQQSTIAGIEAQIGVLYYILESYTDSYNSLRSAVSKFRATGEKKSTIFAVTLNQTGLASLQLYSLKEAADLFEEARSILEAECGQYHVDTLGVYSNLSGVYDALGRTDDAIEILEYLVQLREEKVGTANPEVDDEKRRLAELLKEAGRVRERKSRSLETLLNTNHRTYTDHGNHEIMTL